MDFEIIKRITEGRYGNDEDAFIIERIRKERALNMRGIRSGGYRDNYKNRKSRNSPFKGV